MVLHEEGYSERAISQKIKKSKNAVHNAIIKFRNTGTYSTTQKPGRPRKTTARDDHAIQRIAVRSHTGSFKKIRSALLGYRHQSQNHKQCVVIISILRGGPTRLATTVNYVRKCIKFTCVDFKLGCVDAKSHAIAFCVKTYPSGSFIKNRTNMHEMLNRIKIVFCVKPPLLPFCLLITGALREVFNGAPQLPNAGTAPPQVLKMTSHISDVISRNVLFKILFVGWGEQNLEARTVGLKPT